MTVQGTVNTVVEYFIFSTYVNAIDSIYSLFIYDLLYIFFIFKIPACTGVFKFCMYEAAEQIKMIELS